VKTVLVPAGLCAVGILLIASTALLVLGAPSIHLPSISKSPAVPTEAPIPRALIVSLIQGKAPSASIARAVNENCEMTPESSELYRVVCGARANYLVNVQSGTVQAGDTATASLWRRYEDMRSLAGSGTNALGAQMTAEAGSDRAAEAVATAGAKAGKTAADAAGRAACEANGGLWLGTCYPQRR
jgi:hypothetical protein